MKKYRTKIILGVIIVAVLGAAFFWGGVGDDKGSDAAAVSPGADTAPVESVTPVNTPSIQGSGGGSDDTGSGTTVLETPAQEHQQKPPETTGTQEHQQKPPETTGTQEHQQKPPETTGTQEHQQKPPETTDTQEHQQKPPETTGTQEHQQKPPDIEVSQNLAETTGTEPDDGELLCTITINCKTVLDNLDKLKDGKQEIIPEDGIIYSGTAVFYEGESVFNVLQRELKSNKVHLEFVNAPVYNSAYIEGIGNLYEFDCGERSGWMYSVNGIFPNYGSSRYILSSGDEISWLYTCDRGNDIGGGDAADSYVKE